MCICICPFLRLGNIFFSSPTPPFQVLFSLTEASQGGSWTGRTEQESPPLPEPPSCGAP